MKDSDFINNEQINSTEDFSGGFNNNNETLVEFDEQETTNIIKVIGVGGGGSNAVNYMFKQGIKGVDFVVCNTDAQALQASPVPIKVRLGNRRLGAGSKPEVGKQAAIESAEELRKALEGKTEMLFITAGMGGGTGTGAAPVIAEIAKKLGILTVGIVTIPFEWEGAKRIKLAENGINELRKYVDTLIVISNSKLRELYGNLSLREAFSKADDILKTAAKGIAELITVPGYVNVDFEDVKTVMTENQSGKAIMSSAKAEGENRAVEAVEEALSSPLLNDNDIKGASDILLHIITGSKELTMDEIEEITEFIQNRATVDGINANLIWGNGFDETLGEALSVTIIATGFDNKRKNTGKNQGKTIYDLEKGKKEENKTSQKENTIKNNPEPDSEKEETLEGPVLITNEADEIETDTPPIFSKNEESKPQPETHQEPEKITHTLFGELEEPEKEPQEESSPELQWEPSNKTDEHEINIKEPEPKQFSLEKEQTKKINSERKQKLKNLSNVSMAEKEKIPAYVRKNIELNNTTPSSDENLSRYTLGKDENDKPVINKGNSFLNKDVD